MTTNIDKTVDNMIIISGNDMIDTDEFQGAPFVFGRKYQCLVQVTFISCLTPIQT